MIVQVGILLARELAKAAERLNQLERLGVVDSAPKVDGRGHRYELTSAGRDLFKVCVSLGEWGARWLKIAPENDDPFVALRSMCRRSAGIASRSMHRHSLDFTRRPRGERYWLLIERGDTEICRTCLGIDDLAGVTSDTPASNKDKRA